MNKKLPIKFILLLVLFSFTYQSNAQNGATQAKNACTLPWQDPVSLHDIENPDLDPGYVYTTGQIDISCATNGAEISVDIEGIGGLDEGQDFLNIYYKLDDGAKELLVNRVTKFALETIKSSSLTGSTLEIIIEAGNTAPGEIYRVSNLTVSAASALSVADIEKETILLYPNPVKEVLYVNMNSGKTYSLSLINIIGKEVFSKTNLKGESTFNVESFKEGVYFVKIKTETSQTVKKIIIK